VDRAVRRVAAEDKKKKDAEKARARERMRARDALEKRRRRQEGDGLPREPSPETPDDDDDDDDDKDDDMVAHLGLSPDPGPGQGLPCQPPSGLVPSVPKAGTSGSQSEERRQVEGAPDPSGKVAALTPGSQANPSVLQRQVLVSAAQEVDPPAAAATPRQAVPSAPRAPKVEAAPKSVAGQPLAAPAGTEARWASPQARLALVRSG
jgi:hypothetical protein